MADESNGKPKTELLDELEKGPWPSFVKEIKSACQTSDAPKDLLGQLELSYEEKKGHWKHGGMVGVLGYGGGVIGRYSDLGEQFPKIAHFHTMRVNHPAGWFYTSDALRTICDIWEKHGSGLTNMHGSTGDIILLGTTTDQLEPTFQELAQAGFRSGRLRLRHAYPVLLRRAGALRVGLLRHHEALLRPDHELPGRAAPAGVPLQVQDQVRRLPQRLRGLRRARRPVGHRHLEGRHPGGRGRGGQLRRRRPGYPEGRLRALSHASAWSGTASKLTIDNHECVHCMHCINVMPKALRPGKERGAVLLIGAKAPIMQGALLSSVLVPFVPAEELEDTMKELVSRIWEFWDEYGKNRERVGEIDPARRHAGVPRWHRPGSGAGDGVGAPRQPLHLLPESPGR